MSLKNEAETLKLLLMRILVLTISVSTVLKFFEYTPISVS